MTTHTPRTAETTEIRARIPALLKDQLDAVAVRNYRSLNGEVAAAVTAWIAQHQPASGSGEVA